MRFSPLIDGARLEGAQNGGAAHGGKSRSFHPSAASRAMGPPAPRSSSALSSDGFDLVAGFEAPCDDDVALLVMGGSGEGKEGEERIRGEEMGSAASSLRHHMHRCSTVGREAAAGNEETGGGALMRRLLQRQKGEGLLPGGGPDSPVDPGFHPEATLLLQVARGSEHASRCSSAASFLHLLTTTDHSRLFSIDFHPCIPPSPQRYLLSVRQSSTSGLHISHTQVTNQRALQSWYSLSTPALSSPTPRPPAPHVTSPATGGLPRGEGGPRRREAADEAGRRAGGSGAPGLHRRRAAGRDHVTPQVGRR